MGVDMLYRNAADEIPDEESLIQEALKNIYNKSVDVKNQIEPNLYNTTSKTYRKAIDEGFGTVRFGHPDYDFLQALKHNTDVMAAYKTHRQQNDLAVLMLDENGKLKPFDRFRRDVEDVIGKYNRNWLSTEYNTAVIRARHAARWRDFLGDSDLYPNLKWLETTSPHPDTKVHIRFWNRVWSLTDPFWTRHYPGDRWNCKCGLSNTDDPLTDNSDLDENVFKDDQPDAGIDSNSGVSGEIFTNSHPYVTAAYKGAEKAVKRMMGELEEVRQRRKEIAREAEPLTNETLTNDGLEQQIIVTKKAIKEWLNQPHKHYAEKNEMLLDIKAILANSKYLGRIDDYKNKKDIEGLHLFETEINGDKTWIIVREYKFGRMALYSISDSPEILKGLAK